MAKLNLTRVLTQFQSASAANANYDLIEQAIENTLSRDGSTPNDLSSDLDMGSNDILNVGVLHADDLKVNGYDSVNTIVDEASAARDEAVIAASEATASKEEFFGSYYGAAATDPIVDPNGDAPTEGDLYWNTNSQTMKVYDGTGWVEVTVGLVGGVSSYSFPAATAAQTDFILPYEAKYAQVFLNGAALSDTEYTYTVATKTIALTSGAAADDIVTVLTYNVDHNALPPDYATQSDVADLSGVSDAATARTNLDVYSKADVAPLVNSSVTYTVGATGDYATIQAALDDLSAKYPVNQSTADGVGIHDPFVTLELQSGFVMAEQVSVTYKDLGWIHLTSVDATVSITRSALTEALDGGWVYPAFYAYKATLPTISVQFVMDSSGSATERNGFFLNQSKLLCSGGIRNAGADGIQAYQSELWARGSDFSGAGRYGIVVHRVSSGDCSFADVSGAGDVGLWVNDGSNMNAESLIADSCNYGIRATDTSRINARAADASSCTTLGALAEFNSSINFEAGTASGSATGLSASGSSSIHANIATINNTTVLAVSSSRSSSIDVRSATFTNGVGCLQADSSSSINARDTNISNFTGRVALAASSCKINLHSSTITSSYGSSNILAQNASTLNCRFMTLTNSTAGSVGVRCEGQSRADCSNSNINTVGNEYQIFLGSTQTINGATGGTSINMAAVNTVYSGGIIFQ